MKFREKLRLKEFGLEHKAPLDFVSFEVSTV